MFWIYFISTLVDDEYCSGFLYCCLFVFIFTCAKCQKFCQKLFCKHVMWSISRHLCIFVVLWCHIFATCLRLLVWLLYCKDGLFCSVYSFSRLFTSSDRPSKKLSTSPALSYKGSAKQGSVRPVGDPNRTSRERTDGQMSRAFDFLQDDLYVNNYH